MNMTNLLLKSTKIITLAACLIAPAYAMQESNISREELMQRLQEQDAKIEQLQDQLNQVNRNPASSTVNADEIKSMVKEQVDESVAEQTSYWDDMFETLKRVQIHGFAAQGFLYSTDHNYLYGDTTNGEFEFNEFALNFYTELSQDLSLGIQLFSRDLGVTGNNAIALDYAFAQYKMEDWLGFRVGRVKVPFGLYNETRDLDIVRTNIILPQSVYFESFRDVYYGLYGGGVFGEIDLSSMGNVEYSAVIGTQSIDEENSAVTLSVSDTNLLTTDHEADIDKMMAGRLIWNTPLDGLRVAGSVLYVNNVDFKGPIGPVSGVIGVPMGAPMTAEVSKYLDTVASIEYTFNDLTLAAEYRRRTFDMSATYVGELAPTEEDAFYISADYRLNEKWALGAYYSIYWPDSRDRDGDRFGGNKEFRAWQQDVALSTRYDITPNWIAKLEGHWINGTGDVADYLGNPVSDQNEDWFLIAAKMSFTF